MLELVASYGAESHDELKPRVQAARGPGRPGRGRQAPDPARRTCRATSSASAPASAMRAPGQRQHPAGPVRGRGQGGDRARLVQRVQRDPPELPRPADGIGRHRAQHDRRDDAHRGPAQAVAAADAGAAGAPDRAHHQAGRAARHQRGAAGKGAAAREREEAGRGQESRNRHGPPRGRGEGRAARADLQVQVRIPRQHEPRAAHAAELAADPVEAAGRQSAGQSQRKADRIRAHDQLAPAPTCST